MERDKMNKDSFSFVIYMIYAYADAWNKKPAEVYKIEGDSGMKVFQFPQRNHCIAASARTHNRQEIPFMNRKIYIG